MTSVNSKSQFLYISKKTYDSLVTSEDIDRLSDAILNAHENGTATIRNDLKDLNMFIKNNYKTYFKWMITAIIINAILSILGMYGITVLVSNNFVKKDQ